MTVFVDDQPTDLAGENLAALLEAARQHLEAQQRVVIEVQLDGRTIGEETLNNAAATPVVEHEVRLYTANPHDLAVSTLQQVRQRLGEAHAIQQEAAELLQQDASDRAIPKVGELVEIWLQTQQAVVHSATLLGIDLEQLAVEGEPFERITGDLAEKLTHLKEALSQGDTVSLADELAHEWEETVNRWDALLGQLIERIRA